MKLTKDKSTTWSLAKIEAVVIKENDYIKNLLSTINIPSRNEEENEAGLQKDETQLSKVLNGKPRAKSLTELQQRLEATTSKSYMSYKDKMLRRGIKNKLKKKTKSSERKAKKALIKVGKIKKEDIKLEINEKLAKPVFNSEGKMVFSKFDFSDIGKETKKSGSVDPKKILQKLEEQNEKITQLKESGEVEKAIKIKEKMAWKNALAKAGGVKVKDDPLLLKKSIKKKEQQHKSSKKKWEARCDNVKNKMDERQKKRQENIDKRKKTKKLTKLKKASKRGKIIPGF